MYTAKVGEDEVIVGLEYGGDPDSRAEVFDTRPAAAAVGWRIVCSCSSRASDRTTEWVSELLPRVPSKALENLEVGNFFSADEEVAWLGEIERYEVAARAIWARVHLDPTTSLNAVTQAHRKVVEAEQALNDAVAKARTAGHSWDAIGRATGITRQSAHARWS